MIAALLRKYDEDQPRDERGRWSGGGGFDGAAAESAIAALPPHEANDAFDYEPGSEYELVETPLALSGAPAGAMTAHCWTTARPGVEAALKEVAPSWGEAIARASVEEIDVDRIVTYQTWVNRTQVAKYAADPARLLGSPAGVVFEHEGKMFLVDGNHRVSALKLGGARRVTVLRIGGAGAPAKSMTISDYHPSRPFSEWFDDPPGMPTIALKSLLSSPSSLLRKYDEDQPRDDAGRWTDSGGGAPDGASADALRTALGEGLAGGDTRAVRFDDAANLKADLADAIGARIDGSLPPEMRAAGRAGADVAAQFTDAWAKDSSGTTLQSLMLQRIAADEFRLPDPATSHFDQSAADMSTDAVMAPFLGPARAYLQATHAATQEWFAARGITEVTLYRGVRREKGAAEGEATLHAQPMSSFSADPLVAAAFAKAGGSVYVVRIPVSRVVSTARTGFGCLAEAEVVVLGGKIAARSFVRAKGEKPADFGARVAAATGSGAKAASAVVEIDADTADANWLRGASEPSARAALRRKAADPLECLLRSLREAKAAARDPKVARMVRKLHAAVDAFDWAAWEKAAAAELAREVRDVAAAQGARTARALDLSWEQDDPAMDERMTDYVGERIVEISGTTRQAVKDLIVRTLDESGGAGTVNELGDAVGDAVRAQFAGYEDWRADRIARTETANAYNYGTIEAARRAGIGKVLVSDGGAGDSCEDCEAIDGQIWDLDEALANPVEHPNCTRAFSPLSDEDEATLEEAAANVARELKAFDPSQPRDDRGRWSDGGGGDGALSEATVETALGRLRGVVSNDGNNFRTEDVFAGRTDTSGPGFNEEDEAAGHYEAFDPSAPGVRSIQSFAGTRNVEALIKTPPAEWARIESPPGKIAEMIQSGKQDVPVIVLRDTRTGDQWIADGNHRALAAALLGITVRAFVVDDASDIVAARENGGAGGWR